MKVRKVAISQSNYIPWRGYFDIIMSVSEFVLYDDVQYTRRDWRNRNLIKTPTGPMWLTIPVESKGQYFQTIRETRVLGTDWQVQHWRSIELNYKRARWYSEVSSILAPLYLNRSYETISEVNHAFISEVCRYLKCTTTISSSSDYSLTDGKVERLVGICSQANANVYVTGPAAKTYLSESTFEQNNILVEWFDYVGYVPYEQLWGAFEPAVSIIDVLMNCGPNSSELIGAKS